MDPILTTYVREPNSYTLEFSLKHQAYEGLRKALGDAAGRGHRPRQGIGAARPRRRGLSDRPQVAVRPQGHAAAEVHLLQRRRERARDVQGPRPDGAQPALALRGLPDRLLGHRREGRLHLHSRRVLSRAARARGRARQGLRAGLRRQEHHRHGLRLRHRDSPRRRRLRGGRRNGAHRVARREARAASDQAAVSGGLGPLQLPDGRQQRRDALQPAADPPQRCRVVHLARPREERRAEAFLRQRPRQEARRLRSGR